MDECTASLEVNGQKVACSLRNGPNHNPENQGAHKAALKTDNGGIIVAGG